MTAVLFVSVFLLLTGTHAQAATKKHFAKTPTPTITGVKTVGKTLTGHVGTWKPKPAKLKYQWLRNGVAIKSATKVKYVLVAADKGKRVSLRVTASKSGYTTVAKKSGKTAVVASPPPTTGTVRGKVVGDDHPSVGLTGVAVTAHLWNAAKTAATQKATATTDAAGNYVLGNLAPGVYSLNYSGNAAYSAEWFENQTLQSSAKKVTVTAGGTVTANGSLAPKQPSSGTAAIEGTVTGSDVPGVGLSGITVQLHKATDYTVATSTTTDAQGYYNFDMTDGLSSTAKYVVEFVGTAGYAGEWFDDTPMFWMAKEIKPSASVTVTANAVLAPGGTVAGVIAGSDGSGPITGETAIFCPVVGGAPQNCGGGGTRWSSDNFGSGTGIDGHYSLSLPVGKYVAFVGGYRNPQGQGWHGGWVVGNGEVVDEFSGAQQITVTRNQTTTVNPLDYPNQATFHGTITTPSPTGTQTSIRYCAFNPAQASDPVTHGCSADVYVPSNPVGGATSSTWTYSTVLLDGTYKVWFEYYDGFDGHDLARGYNMSQVDLHGGGTTIESAVLTVRGHAIDYSFSWTW